MYTNDFVHVWNQLTGSHQGNAPSYATFWDAVFNRDASYPGQANPNGYVTTSSLRDIKPSPSSSTVLPKPKVDLSSKAVFNEVNSLLSRSVGSGGSGAASSGSSPLPPSVPNYLNADLARHYGMDASTAYTEALANTAHQREVKDLQAAGLNPVLSSRYGGSSTVSGAAAYAPPVVDVSSGASSAKQASTLANLASGVVALVTGNSAKSNATKDIVNTLGDIVSSFSTRE